MQGWFKNRLTANSYQGNTLTDRHSSDIYTFHQTHSQTKPPNQPVVVSYPGHNGRELTRPRGHRPDNRQSIDGEDVPLKDGRLDPGMLYQARKSWSLPFIDEFKMVKHKREKFFVPGKVNGRCYLLEPFYTEHVRCLLCSKFKMLGRLRISVFSMVAISPQWPTGK